MEDENIQRAFERIDAFPSWVDAKLAGTASKIEKVCTNIVNGTSKASQYLGDSLRGYGAEQCMTTLGPLGETFVGYLEQNSNNTNNNLSIYSAATGMFAGVIYDLAIVVGLVGKVVSLLEPSICPNDPMLDAGLNASTGIAIAKGMGLAAGFAYRYGRKYEQAQNKVGGKQ